MNDVRYTIGAEGFKVGAMKFARVGESRWAEIEGGGMQGRSASPELSKALESGFWLWRAGGFAPWSGSIPFDVVFAPAPPAEKVPASKVAEGMQVMAVRDAEIKVASVAMPAMTRNVPARAVVAAVKKPKKKGFFASLFSIFSKKRRR